jgi:hypothetical protein
MGASDSNQIPAILKLVSEAKPQSILDLGVGWGRYGVLFRLSFEAGYSEISDRGQWRIRIDGVEGFAPYIGAIQRSVYNDIFLFSIHEIAPKLRNYDVIFMGDVIEHIEKQAGRALLKHLLEKTDVRLIVATPNGPYEQGALHGNEFERHRSFWRPEDFLEFSYHEIYQNRKSIIAVLSRQPIPAIGRRWSVGPFRRYPLSVNLRARWKYYCYKWFAKGRLSQNRPSEPE